MRALVFDTDVRLADREEPVRGLVEAHRVREIGNSTVRVEDES